MRELNPDLDVSWAGLCRGLCRGLAQFLGAYAGGLARYWPSVFAILTSVRGLNTGEILSPPFLGSCEFSKTDAS